MNICKVFSTNTKISYSLFSQLWKKLHGAMSMPFVELCKVDKDGYWYQTNTFIRRRFRQYFIFNTLHKNEGVLNSQMFWRFFFFFF